MRIARFRHEGTTSWGFVVDEAIAVAPAHGPGLVEALALGADALAELAGSTSAPIQLEDVRLLAPVAVPRQFIGVGLNYRDHAAETGAQIPAAPITFGFLTTSVSGPDDPIVLPPFTDQVDWEVELAVVIGQGGRDIPVDGALEAVAGYTIVNDLSARDIQRSEGQWGRSKSFDSFKPMGPWITTVDELGAADSVGVRLWVNDVLKQDSTTADLIFDVPTLVSALSASTTLLPGAVISTGTPGGVGHARTPPEFLRAGDTVTLEIEGIGTLSNPVVAG